MTRQTRDWLRDHWWHMGLALLAIGGWVARVEAAVDDVKSDHDITRGLGRLECIRDRWTAAAAGLPCGDLLNDRGPR